MPTFLSAWSHSQKNLFMRRCCVPLSPRQMPTRKSAWQAESLRYGELVAGGGCGLAQDGDFAGALRLRADDVDAAFEVRAVVDADAGGLDVADETALLADGDLLSDLDVAADGAIDGYLAGANVGFDLAVWADSDGALGFDGAFDVAFHHQLFAAADLAFYF